MTGHILSVCMIVKNEAHQLANILNDCQSFADEIIVVDTGSTDNTKEIARQFTPNIYDFEWCDDFSAARNYSLKQATGKYILILDADDRVDEFNQALIQRLKDEILPQKTERVLLFGIHNVGHHQEGKGFYQIRCFPNRPDIYYEGWAHNQPAPSIERAGFKATTTNLRIIHTGYADVSVYMQKRDRALRILKKELKEKPLDGRVNLYLGMLYEKNENFEDAKKHFKTAVLHFEPKINKRPWGLYESLCGLVRINSTLGNKEKALDYFNRLSSFTADAPSEVSIQVTNLAEQYGLYDQFQGKPDDYQDVDVLLLASEDYANLGYTFSKCLQSVGINALMLSQTEHPFLYPEQGIKVDSIKDIRRYALNAPIIQFMHSQYLQTGVDLRKKRVFMFHGGTAYRRYHKTLNKNLNPKVEGTLTQTLDLIGKGAKNEKWLLPAVDTEKLQPVSGNGNGKVVIGHFPNDSKKKATAFFEKAIEKLKQDPELNDRFEYITSDDPVSWQEQIERMSACDIYAEMSKRGGWGITALEAAALGKVVINNFEGLERYREEYGACGLTVAIELEEIVAKLKELILMPTQDLDELKRKTRAWVEQKHSYQAIGKRLREIYQI